MSSSEGTKLVKRQLTKDEWDALKPDIRKLYIDENKSFSQVSSVLKNDHQFNPTKKQFDFNIKKWGFNKNANKEQRVQILGALGDGAVEHTDLGNIRMTTNKLLRWKRDDGDRVLGSGSDIRSKPPQRETTTPALIEAQVPSTYIDNQELAAAKDPEKDSTFHQNFEDNTLWAWQTITRKETLNSRLTPITVKNIVAILGTITDSRPLKKYVSLEELSITPGSLVGGAQTPKDLISKHNRVFLAPGFDLEYRQLHSFKIQSEEQSPGFTMAPKGSGWSAPPTSRLQPRTGDSQLSIWLQHVARTVKPCQQLNISFSSTAMRVTHPKELSCRKYLDTQILECQRRLEKLNILPSGDLENIEATDRLATFYRAKGMFKAAKTHYAQVAIARRSLLGPKHPDTVGTYLDVVDAMIEEGEYHEARRVHHTIHNAILKNFKPDCDLAIRSMVIMTDIYYYLEWNPSAETLEREALQLSLTHYGIHHQYSSKTMGNFAITLRAKVASGHQQQSALVTSEGLLRTAIQIDNELGDKSQTAYYRVLHLALVLFQRGKHEESITLNRQLSRNSRTTFGSEHPVTLEILSYLGRAFLKTGDFERSEPIMRLSVISLQKVFGPENKLTTDGLEELAETLTRLQFWEEAAIFYEELYQLNEKNYDIEHEIELRGKIRLRDCYRQQGLYSQDVQFDDRLDFIVQGKNPLPEFNGKVRKGCRVERDGWFGEDDSRAAKRARFMGVEFGQ